MERTWRWFGKKDKITLAMLRQIGVEGIVTALHDVPLGEVWTREKIRDLREYIESYGMRFAISVRLSTSSTSISSKKSIIDFRIADSSASCLMFLSSSIILAIQTTYNLFSLFNFTL